MMPPLIPTFRAVALVLALVLVAFVLLAGAACAAPVAAAAAPTAASWLAEPATWWDIAKTIAPVVVTIIAWAWRVERSIARHDMMLDRQTQTLAKIEDTLEAWTEVKEERAERLARVEAKLDLIMAQVAR